MMTINTMPDEESLEVTVGSLRRPVEATESPERLITSSEVNKAGAAKANALWGGNQLRTFVEVPEEAVEAAQAAWVRNGSHIPTATSDKEDPEYKEHLRSAMRSSLSAALPFMNRVVTSEEGLLPGTVLQDKTGDVLKLMDNGEWWGTDEEGATFVDYPAIVLAEGGGKGRPFGYNDS